mmetsp:Transcript_40559/g.114742  ORF Transcript_40559/g.114742 Transcript_40559/m.114742 type:complete len:234 (+) Transcript_40559:648-1349(+)
MRLPDGDAGLHRAGGGRDEGVPRGQSRAGPGLEAPEELPMHAVAMRQLRQVRPPALGAVLRRELGELRGDRRGDPAEVPPPVLRRGPRGLAAQVRRGQRNVVAELWEAVAQLELYLRKGAPHDDPAHGVADKVGPQRRGIRAVALGLQSGDDLGSREPRARVHARAHEPRRRGQRPQGDDPPLGQARAENLDPRVPISVGAPHAVHEETNVEHGGGCAAAVGGLHGGNGEARH